MKSIAPTILVAFLILGISIAPSAEASPAAPSFFERISEWVGDVFTFGDIAKAERNIKKAEAIFQDLSNNAPKDDSFDVFFKNGLVNYQKRIENAEIHLEKAKQKGSDVSSIGKTINEVTNRHTSILEARKNQLSDKAEGVGLLRALEVVKEANTRAREAVGEALERKNESGQVQKPEIQSPAVATSNRLLGWWEETESWSINPQSGNLKKNATAFPFLHEFTDKYFCTQYSAKFTCINNISYSAIGNKILLEGSSVFYEWKIVDGKLELVFKDAKGQAFSKSLFKKISPPTSTGKITAPAFTKPGLAEKPKANLKLLKVGESGLCLKHDGGDSIPITNLYVKLNGNSVSQGSFQQFPSFTDDYIFDPGEFFVLTVMFPPSRSSSFRIDDTVEITDVAGSPLVGPTSIQKIEPRDERAPSLIGGLALCP